VEKRREGFTLIELLVVIAVIAILAAILFPIFVRAKTTANRSKCLSNCRQIAEALTIYKGDFDGSWPHCDYATSEPWWPKYNFSFWMVMLEDYAKSSNVYKCPATANGLRKQNDGREWDERYNIFTTATIKKMFPAANYGVNEYLFHKIFGNYVKESALRLPAKTALVADCNSTLFHDWNDDHNLTGPDGITLTSGMLRLKYANSFDTSPPNQFGRGRLRHEGENVVFADCHASFIPSRAFYCTQPGVLPRYQWPVIHPMAQPPPR